MERHNRKSYLGPAPPQSIKEDSAHAKPPPKPAASKPSRTPHYTPTSEDIQVNITNDSDRRHYYPPSNPSPKPARSALSPPALALEHLSLETRDEDLRPGRVSSRSRSPRNDPSSAVDTPSRPFMAPRSASSHNANSRAALQTTLPVRTAPPPGGLPPAPPGPPGSGGARWQRQANQMRGDATWRAP